MLVIRFLIAVILGTLIYGMLVLAVIGAVLGTLYFGLTERDWKKEEWAELIPMVKEFFNGLALFIKTGDFSKD